MQFSFFWLCSMSIKVLTSPSEAEWKAITAVRSLEGFSGLKRWGDCAPAPLMNRFHWSEAISRRNRSTLFRWLRIFTSFLIGNYRKYFDPLYSGRHLIDSPTFPFIHSGWEAAAICETFQAFIETFFEIFDPLGGGGIADQKLSISSETDQQWDCNDYSMLIGDARRKRFEKLPLKCFPLWNGIYLTLCSKFFFRAEHRGLLNPQMQYCISEGSLSYVAWKCFNCFSFSIICLP